MTDYAVIIAGGSIDEEFALRFLKDRRAEGEIFLIAADRGLEFLRRYQIEPDLIVGDFDSSPCGLVEGYTTEHPDIMVQKFNWEKDYSDTEIAVKAAVSQGCRRVDILGATGSRLDHVFGAIQLLSYLLDRGCEGRILDPHNRISLHEKSFLVRKEDQWGKYVSFFSRGDAVKNVTLRGFHFPMEKGTVETDSTLTVSNQIEEREAFVEFDEGRLIMIESSD